MSHRPTSPAVALSSNPFSPPQPDSKDVNYVIGVGFLLDSLKEVNDLQSFAPSARALFRLDDDLSRECVSFHVAFEILTLVGEDRGPRHRATMLVRTP